MIVSASRRFFVAIRVVIIGKTIKRGTMCNFIHDIDFVVFLQILISIIVLLRIPESEPIYKTSKSADF
jgi:hypothetical protein